MTPNDIYYVTSKDGGKMWAKPLKVTDNAKDGIRTSGPQVAVQNGVIHLFYVQGKEDRHLSRQAPWPVYYQQRPFPN
jgi:Neuraminidase (sialidase)